MDGKFKKEIEEIGVLIYEKNEVLLALEKLEKVIKNLKNKIGEKF